MSVSDGLVGQIRLLPGVRDGVPMLTEIRQVIRDAGGYLGNLAVAGIEYHAVVALTQELSTPVPDRIYSCVRRVLWNVNTLVQIVRKMLNRILGHFVLTAAVARYGSAVAVVLGNCKRVFAVYFSFFAASLVLRECERITDTVA